MFAKYHRCYCHMVFLSSNFAFVCLSPRLGLPGVGFRGKGSIKSADPLSFSTKILKTSFCITEIVFFSTVLKYFFVTLNALAVDLCPSYRHHTFIKTSLCLLTCMNFSLRIYYLQPTKKNQSTKINHYRQHETFKIERNFIASIYHTYLGKPID